MSTDTPKVRLEAFLNEYPGTKYIRMIITTYSGHQKMKTIPVHHALQVATKSNALVPGTESAPAAGQSSAGTDGRGVVCGPLSVAAGVMVYIGDVASDFGAVEPGEDCLQIDWTSLKPTLSDPTCAYAACSVYHTAPSAPGELRGSGYELDPRVLLRGVEQRAKSELDLEFLIGHEVEFILFDSADSTTPLLDITNGLWANQSGSRGMSILQEITDGLEHAGVHVWSLLSEDGTKGQFEFQTCPAPPLESCNQLEFALHTIRCVANKHNCIATVSATPFGGGLNGRHFHVSHTHPEVNDHFRAGIMHHLPALSAVLQGNIEGWEKRKSMTAAGSVAWWGKSKASIINNKAPGRYEIRLGDAHFNAHLQLASVLLAGMDGVQEKRKANQDEEMQHADALKYFLAHQDSTVRAEMQRKYKLDVAMPKDLGEAIEKYEADMEMWKVGLNDRAANGILKVLKKRWADRAKLPMDEARKRLMRSV